MSVGQSDGAGGWRHEQDDKNTPGTDCLVRIRWLGRVCRRETRPGRNMRTGRACRNESDTGGAMCEGNGGGDDMDDDTHGACDKGCACSVGSALRSGTRWPFNTSACNCVMATTSACKVRSRRAGVRSTSASG
jgi:hypothetical protein